MAEGDSDNAEKTEEPTQKRIAEAVKKGQIATSREVVNFFMLVVLALNIMWFAPYYMNKATILLSRFIRSPHEIIIDEKSIINLMSETTIDIGIFMLPPILATIVAAIAANFIQNGFVISGESLIPKLEKISLFKGIKRMFSMKSLVEFIKGLFKISIVGIVAYIVVISDVEKIENLVSFDVDAIIHILTTLAFKMVIGAGFIMAVIAVLDFLYQKFEYIKSLKMTKQEVKEEFKQSEGDPNIKAKLRQIRQERSRRRMMAQVPDADVIIRNPEHYAIALKYDEATMDAPVVLAMGIDNIALKIIEIAEEHDIITVRNPPLARALYDSGKIDEEVPLEHYKAVAEVIGYVYKVRGNQKAAQATYE